MTETNETAEPSGASDGSLAGIGPVVRKPAAYIVYVDGIGSIMPLCRDMIEVDGLRSRFADRVHEVVPLYRLPTLTAEEREAVECGIQAIGLAPCDEKTLALADTLRSLLERL